MPTPTDSWGLAEGDALTPELSALRKLGGGAAFEAWLAFDEVTWSPVVVKLVRPDQVDDESTLRGLRREVHALELLRHPVLLRSLRAETEGPRPHVVLENIDGPRLSTLVRRYGRLQEQQYLPLAIDVAAALHYLRRMGWTHLDIKPSNVIMGAPARLIDLSVARPTAEARRLHAIIGTDAYMAPEQCDPGGEWGSPSPASDVWGLGSTLYHAVAGQRAFNDPDRGAQTLAEGFPQTVQDPRPLPTDVPPAVAHVPRACLDRDPAGRPLPHEVADALEPVLADLPRGSLGGFKIRR